MLRRKIYEILRKYKIYGILVAVVLIGGIGFLGYFAKPIIDFEQCVADRGVVWTSYPSKCFSADGKILVSPYFLDEVELISDHLRN